jgi:hypothetical protein
MLVTVCKQTTRNTGSNLRERHRYELFTRNSIDMGYQPIYDTGKLRIRYNEIKLIGVVDTTLCDKVCQ